MRFLPCRVGSGIISTASSDVPSRNADERLDSPLLTLLVRRVPFCRRDPRRANRLLKLRPELTEAEWIDVEWTDAERTDAEAERTDAEHVELDLDGDASESWPRLGEPGPPDAVGTGRLLRNELDEEGMGDCLAIKVSEAYA